MTYKVEIVYYEGYFNRTLGISRAKMAGEDPFRPYRIRSTGTYPIIPRPGDHVWFPLDDKSARYFKGEERNGKTYIGGVVQWAEMYDGDETIYVTVTDEGHHGRGVYSGDIEKECEEVTRLLET